jgi:hypothetical protein
LTSAGMVWPPAAGPFSKGAPAANDRRCVRLAPEDTKGTAPVEGSVAKASEGPPADAASVRELRKSLTSRVAAANDRNH